MQYLLGWLLENVDGMPGRLKWVLGDPGASKPQSLPIVFIAPLFDTVKPLSNGVDTDTYVIPILLLDDFADYGPPVENPDAAGTYVQPGYVTLMTYAESIRDALRYNGASITFNGTVATSQVPAISYPWVLIDSKPYRGARIALQVTQRRMRGGA